MKLQALYDHVLVEPVDGVEFVSKSGIVVVKSEKKMTVGGRVVSVGEGRITPEGKLMELLIKAGEIVYFNKMGCDELEFEGRTYLSVREGNILAVEKDDLPF